MSGELIWFDSKVVLLTPEDGYDNPAEADVWYELRRCIDPLDCMPMLDTMAKASGMPRLSGRMGEILIEHRQYARGAILEAKAFVEAYTLARRDVEGNT